jgi:nitrogen regulatory protein PII
MNLVIAIIKPFKLEEVRDALTVFGIHGMTITELKVTAGKRATPRSTGARNTP